MISTLKRIWSNTKDFGKMSFIFRSVSFFFAVVVIFLHFFESGIPLPVSFYVTLGVLVVIPPAYFLDYALGGSQITTAIKHLIIDLFIVGWGIGLINLSLVPSAIYIVAAASNYIAIRGFRQPYYFLLVPLACIASLSLHNFEIRLASSQLMDIVSVCYAAIHFLTLAYIMLLYNQRHIDNRRVIEEQNREISSQNEEIRAQTEELIVLNEALKEINRQLEKNVTDKTQESIIKTQLLAEYAFINAHELRAPVATIIGLLQFFDYPVDHDFRQEVIKKLKITSINLDDTIKSIRIKLESQGLLSYPASELGKDMKITQTNAKDQSGRLESF